MGKNSVEEMKQYIWEESVYFRDHIDEKRLLVFYEEITKTDFLTWKEKNFLWQQIARWSFIHGEYATSEIFKKQWLLERQVVQEFREAFLKEEIAPIPFQERNQKFVVIITSQVIETGHGPTKSALDRAACLQDLGYQVLLINTAELLTLEGEIPFEEVITGNYVDELLNQDIYEWKEHKIPYFQCYQNMPNMEDMETLFETIRKLKPCFAMEIGNQSLLAKCVDALIPVVSISMGPSIITPFESSYQTLNHELAENEKEVFAAMGVGEERLLPLPFTFGIKEPKRRYQKAELYVPEDAFVSCVVGARLDEDVTEEFLQFAKQVVSEKHYMIFMGIWPKYEEVMASHEELRPYLKYLGMQEDVAGIMSSIELYINPRRRGGGTSAVEAMAQGIPALTIDYGDVALNVAPEFLCKDYGEMLAQIRRYETDVAYYEAAQEIASKRAEYMLDTKGAMRDLCKQVYEKEKLKDSLK